MEGWLDRHGMTDDIIGFGSSTKVEKYRDSYLLVQRGKLSPTAEGLVGGHTVDHYPHISIKLQSSPPSP
jgi:hypothetical protein